MTWSAKPNGDDVMLTIRGVEHHLESDVWMSIADALGEMKLKRERQKLRENFIAKRMNAWRLAAGEASYTSMTRTVTSALHRTRSRRQVRCNVCTAEIPANAKHWRTGNCKDEGGNWVGDPVFRGRFCDECVQYSETAPVSWYERMGVVH